MNTILSIKNLNKHYKKNQVLFDINFDCNEGRIVGLIGPNGAGKTTIMKSILALIKSNGSITIDGKKILFNKGQLSDTIGALIENPGIYPYLSGLDHLKMFSKKNNQEEINQLVSELEMSEYIKKKASQYSLGMKQKLGIALALINNPKLVILDEPMNGLDPKATKNLRNLIKKRASNGVTFLISSHLLSELQKLADDVILVSNGKIIKKDTMENILNTSKHIALLKTSNDISAKSLLTKAGFELNADNSKIQLLISNDEDVEKAVTFLLNNNISVLDIHHEKNDLEDTVLNLINF